MCQFLSLLSLGAAALFASSAKAVPSSRLVYVRGEGAEICPEAIELRLAVLHRLGYNPFDPSAKLCILVQVRQNGEKLRATVELLDEQGLSRGTRHLDAPIDNCAELITAAALSISLAIDPERALTHSDEPRPTDKRTVPNVPAPDARIDETATLKTPSSTVPAPTKERRSTHGEFVLSLHGASHALVKPNLGLDVGLGLRREHWSLSVEARTDLPVTRAVGDEARLTTWLVMGAVAPCVRGAALRFCGLLGYGVLGASSSGVRHPKDDHASYATVGLRLGTERRVARRLRLGVHVDALTSFSTYQANLGNVTIWESSRLSGLFGFDVAWDI
jgi:hypothetical protein